MLAHNNKLLDAKRKTRPAKKSADPPSRSEESAMTGYEERERRAIEAEARLRNGSGRS